MVVAFISPIEFFKSVFWYGISCKVWSCTTKTISVSRCKPLEMRFFYRKLKSSSQRNLFSVFHRNSLNYSNDQGEKLNWKCFTFFLKLFREWHTGLCAITTPSYKQPNKLSQPQKNSIELTYSKFSCHLKVKRDQLVLISCLWMEVYRRQKIDDYR